MMNNVKVNRYGAVRGVLNLSHKAFSLYLLRVYILYVRRYVYIHLICIQCKGTYFMYFLLKQAL